MMFLNKLKVVAAAVLVLALCGGAGVLTYRAPAGERRDGDKPVPQAQAADPAANPKAPAPPPPARPMQDVPSARDGILVVVGTEVKEGEKVPKDRLVEVTIAGEVRRFARLKEGDKVEKGQLLALLDPTLALDDVAIAKSKVEAAKADYAASLKTRDAAKERLLTLQKLAQGPNPTVSKEELSAAQLTYDRYFFEEAGKKEGVNAAEKELRRAENVLKTYEIRSPARGTVLQLHKRQGDAARGYDPVVRILLDEADE
jgi:multidrug efflux pump subunit AcrA (membrane-fusion protein)